ncbi:hypothetical protein ACF08N_11425 [Streptomyces sp. NPDC015127]|uniref:hypothetical protein n=1 Tax=Streptomyces sp. NPDC015127 TaxID=3364939 RepID=UPI0036F5498D
MIPQLRARCAITVASLALATLPLAPAAHAEPSAPPGPRPVVKPSPSPSTSFAGRHAGQGRPRPGRQEPATTGRASPSVDPLRSATSPAASEPARLARQPSRSTGPSPSTPRTAPRTDDAEHDPPPVDDGGPQRDRDHGYWDVRPPAAPPSAPAEAGDQGPQAVPEPVAQQISPLSLGVGMALMGLGIGFLGIRLRRR